MSEFEFPTNIRQIGSISEGIRIYVEDYVCSYLQQLAEDGDNDERFAILVGRDMVIDGNTVLFISGAVQGLYIEHDSEKINIPDKTWQYTEQQVKKYFKGMEVVGWMISQPGYGIRLRQPSSLAHKNHFPDKRQVVFAIDPTERLNAFYIWETERETLMETRGYFVYYDKNRGMHEYMLENKSKLPSDTEGVGQITPMPRIIEKRKLGEPEAVVRRRQSERIRRSSNEQKKLLNMLVSLSAVLFLVCFIMGAGLIQSDGRISSMESQLNNLHTAYRDLLVQIKEDRTAEVFAPQNPAYDAQLIQEDGNQALADDLVVQAESTQEPTATPTPETTPSTPTPSPTPSPEDSAETSGEATVETPDDYSSEKPEVSTLEVWDTYAVEKGDTLSYISEKFYGTSKMVDKIMEINDLDNPNTIYFGKILKLPVVN